MKDKLDLYLDVLNECDSVSDDNIKQIFEDKELTEIHRIVCNTTGALTETSEVDIDCEWQKFERRNFHSRHFGYISVLSRFLSRNVATVMICIVSSLAVVATSIGLTHFFKGQSKEQNVTVENIVTYDTDDAIAIHSVTESSQQMPPGGSTVFKNRSLNEILHVIADYYGASIISKSDISKDLRLYFQWDQSLPMEEVITQLNSFEQVDITLDNNVISIE